ncbi:MAG: hypothetical protein KA144_07740 [Xanthomonadaceae bacterium]|nr:hypothetical protein [Xanthomonadaceae bacterium]
MNDTDAGNGADDSALTAVSAVLPNRGKASLSAGSSFGGLRLGRADIMNTIGEVS